MNHTVYGWNPSQGNPIKGVQDLGHRCIVWLPSHPPATSEFACSQTSSPFFSMTIYPFKEKKTCFLKNSLRGNINGNVNGRILEECISLQLGIVETFKIICQKYFFPLPSNPKKTACRLQLLCWTCRLIDTKNKNSDLLFFRWNITNTSHFLGPNKLFSPETTVSRSPRPSPTWWQPNHLWDQRWSTAWSALASLRRAQSLEHVNGWSVFNACSMECCHYSILAYHIYIDIYIYLYTVQIYCTPLVVWYLGRLKLIKFTHRFPPPPPSSCLTTSAKALTMDSFQGQHFSQRKRGARVWEKGVFHPKPSEKKNNG